MRLNTEKEYLELKEKLDGLFIPSTLQFSHDSIELVRELIKTI